ncbi:MAG: serine hydrolase domain-containing protein [Saprospiraceae bacterium]
MKSFISYILFLSLFGLNAFSQNKQIIIPEIDSLIQSKIKEGAPGVVIGVIKNGAFVHKKAYGLANLDYDIPLTTSSVFRIASTSKQFTAASIILLEQQGKINLNDDIRKYLNDFPFYGDTIRIKHLIYHTSGLRDYTGLMYLCGLEDDYPYTPKDLYQLIIRQKGLDFEPGTQFSYSNTGYFLLSKIVESKTGSSLNTYAKDNLFIPLEMKNTHFHDNHKLIVKNRAYGYSFGKDTYEIAMSNNDIVGDGGIFTTLDDLKLWDDNFYSHKVGGIGWYKKMVTPGELNDKSTIPYAGGLFIRTFRGLKKINHTGWYAGFKSSIAQYPEEKTTIIILANSPDLEPPILTNQIAEIVLSNKLTPRTSSEKRKGNDNLENKPPSETPKEIMEALVGDYYSQELNFKYQIFIKEGNLACKIGNNKMMQLQYINKDLFMVDEYVSLIPKWEKENLISSFSLSVGDSKNIWFKRI